MRYASALLLIGCAEDPAPKEQGPGWDYPLDDVLGPEHIQALGTHNSYHRRTEGSSLVEWDYEHRPLEEQLGLLGVRQFELDIWWDAEAEAFAVYHVPIIDEQTTCATLQLCLSEMQAWSARNPAHHPLFTLIEIKDNVSEEEAADYLASLDEELLAVWPTEQLIRPDDVQGEAESLRAAVESAGWPRLGALRGRALFVLHTGSPLREAYTDGLTTTAGAVLFPDGGGELDLPISATHTINDPIGDASLIAEAAGRSHLVRTRADSDPSQAIANDTAQRDAALASAAHFLSSDWPEPRPETGYVVQMEGGTPSRCNAATAPVECSSEAIEDPQYIEP
jgi:hypothetical protein